MSENNSTKCKLIRLFNVKKEKTRDKKKSIKKKRIKKKRKNQTKNPSR